MKLKLNGVLSLVLGLSLASSAFAMQAPLPPNEMGGIMIFMYHQIRSPERDYVRSAANFRKDLETLYAKGYRLANLNDVIDGRIKTARGRTPVVFTFDDAAYGQINKIRQPDGSEIWDPQSAVGMILEFAKEHPDMGVAGTFYVNPFEAHMDRSKSARWADWMKEMVKLGFEFGNHTYTHPILSKQDPTYPQVEAEIGKLAAWVHQRLPGYPLRSMALPFGVYPRDTEWAVTGTYNGQTYHHEILLKVGAEPAPSPFSRAWNPEHVPRVRAQDVTGSLPVSGYWLAYYDHHPEKRFVSDGDPSVVTIPAGTNGMVRENFVSRIGVSVHVR